VEDYRCTDRPRVSDNSSGENQRERAEYPRKATSVIAPGAHVLPVGPTPGSAAKMRFNEDMGARMRALSYKTTRFVSCIPLFGGSLIRQRKSQALFHPSITGPLRLWFGLALEPTIQPPPE
jgi:hypothetical protein